MSRPIRLEYAGAKYHVNSRGNERKAIFREDKDYQHFLKILAESKEKYGIKIFAYILMTNHYHLVFETPNSNLIKVIHNINLRYSQYFNRKYKRSGHFFQSRYSSCIIDGEAYLLEAIRYAHLNPIRAYMVETLDKYRWSSYREYVRSTSVYVADIMEILPIFHEKKNKAIKMFKEHTTQASKKDIKELRNEIYGDKILGNDSFIGKIKGMARELKRSKEVVEAKILDDSDKAESILQQVCKVYNIDRLGLEGKRGYKNEARKAAIYLIYKNTGLKTREMGDLFGGVHYCTITNTAARVEKNKKLKRKAEKIFEKIA